MAETPAKKAKTGETEEEPPKELEKNAPADRSQRIKVAPCFHPEDTTMNVMPAAFGNILMPLTDGGLQYLLAGARANVGVKSGRYMFEVKILEVLNPAEDPAARHKTPMPRNQLRVGFATAGATLFVGEGEEHAVSFDAEGAFVKAGKKEGEAAKFGAGDSVAVVLNLDASGDNARTVSLFKNGERACQPQPLPESLKGEALFPAITFKNVAVHYNFGPTPIKALPFTCRMVNDASVKDSTVVPAVEKAKDGKHEVVFPSVLPDEGGFDWLDHFLEKNKGYEELSDRAILTWAERSGLSRPKGYATRTCNDRPEMGFGISMMDDGSVRRVLNAVAPTQPRNFVVMEVRSNLLKEERKEGLARWAGAGFKRSAAVLVGEPPPPLKKRCQEMLIRAKQEKVTAEWRAENERVKKRKLLEKRQRQLERERRKAERAAKRKQEELIRKAEAEAKAKEADEAGEKKDEEKKEEEKKEEEKKEEEKKKEEEEDEDEKSAEEPEEPEGEPPKAELSAEEKQQWFRTLPAPDLATQTLNASFVKFTLPEKEEGFDEVRHEWTTKPDQCKEYLKQWVRDRKISTRIDDLQPGEWFAGKWKEWQKTVQAWHGKQNQHKQAMAQKAAEAAAKEKKKAAEKAAAEAKAQAAKAKAELERKEKEAKEKEGKEDTEDKAGEGKEEEKKEEDKKMEVEEEKKEEKEEEEEKEEPGPNFDAIDIFGVEDILDVGAGQPLFSEFGFEDWTMMGLRYELHLLAHSFRRDVKDPERIGIHLDHLEFYYLKYFKKGLNLKFYGVESLKELVELIRDTVAVGGKHQVLETLIPDDMDSVGLFAMLTEESRRNRNLRIDLGEEGAKLKLSQPTVMTPGLPATAAAAQRPPPALRPGIQGVVQVPVRPLVAPGGALRPAAGPVGVGRPAGPQGWTPRPTVTTSFASGRPPMVTTFRAPGAAYQGGVTTFRAPGAAFQARPFTSVQSWRPYGPR